MKHYNWLTQNGKMRKTGKKHGVRLFNWGIPAFRAKDGFKTCPKAGACAVGCYAKSGAYLFSNVAAVFEKRLALTKTAEFQATLSAEIGRRKADVVRIHDSGDFYSLEYILKWRNIMLEHPDVQFYAYTKEVRRFKALVARGVLPPNFKVVYSFGGLEDAFIDVNVDKHAKVFETLDALQKAGYTDTTDDDLQVLGATKIGLVYHGTKGYAKTAWKKVG